MPMAGTRTLLISLMAAAVLAGAAPAASADGVGGGLELPPPLSSLQAARTGAKMRTRAASAAVLRPAARGLCPVAGCPRLRSPRLRSLPRTIWLTTGCPSGQGAPGAFRVSLQKA